MKKLVTILIALCMLTGYSTECVADVIDVFTDNQLSSTEKTIAIDVMTEKLEILYENLSNDINPYGLNRNCNCY